MTGVLLLTPAHRCTLLPGDAPTDLEAEEEDGVEDTEGQVDLFPAVHDSGSDEVEQEEGEAIAGRVLWAVDVVPVVKLLIPMNHPHNT